MISSPNCEICPIVQHPDEIEEQMRIYTGEHWVSTLRQDGQILPGTSYVTLLTHKEAPEDLTFDEELEFIEIRNRLSIAQKKAFGAEVINISCLMNNAFQTDPAAPHVHYHFKPRYRNPISIGGETFVDEQFGRYITAMPHRPVSLDLKKEIIARLQENWE